MTKQEKLAKVSELAQENLGKAQQQQKRCMTRTPEIVNSRLCSCPASNFHIKAVSSVARTVSSVEESWTSDL